MCLSIKKTSIHKDYLPNISFSVAAVTLKRKLLAVVHFIEPFRLGRTSDIIESNH